MSPFSRTTHHPIPGTFDLEHPPLAFDSGALLLLQRERQLLDPLDEGVPLRSLRLQLLVVVRRLMGGRMIHELLNFIKYIVVCIY